MREQIIRDLHHPFLNIIDSLMEASRAKKNYTSKVLLISKAFYFYDSSKRHD